MCGWRGGRARHETAHGVDPVGSSTRFTKLTAGVGARAPLERSAHSSGVGIAAFPDEGGDIASLLVVADRRLPALERRLYARSERRAA
jgi:hypothetical protein